MTTLDWLAPFFRRCYSKAPAKAIAILLAASALLIGCGGGSGGGSEIPPGNGDICSPSSEPTTQASLQWLAYQVRPNRLAENAMGAGIYVIPSASPTDSPSLVGQGQYFFKRNFFRHGDPVNGRFSQAVPEVNVYASENGGVYRLDLNQAIPLLQQLSSAQLETCSLFVSQTDLTDPSSGVVVQRSPGADGSCGGTDQFLLMRYNDSDTQAPQAINLDSTQIQALYNADGSLAGLLAQQGQSLMFYPDFSFAAGTALMEDIDFFFILAAESGDVLISVFGEGDRDGVYHINTLGELSQRLFPLDRSDVHYHQTTPDGENLIVVTTRSNSPPVSFDPLSLSHQIVQVPMDGLADAVVLKTIEGQGIPYYEIFAVTDSRIVLLENDGNLDGAQQLLAMPVNGGALQRVFTPPSGSRIDRLYGVYAHQDTLYFDVFIEPEDTQALPVIGDPLSLLDLSSSPGDFLSLALNVTSKRLETTEHARTIAALQTDFNTAPTLIQAHNIQNASEWGGSTIRAIDLNRCETSTLSASNGADFQVPEGYVSGYLSGSGNSGNTVLVTLQQRAATSSGNQNDLLLIELDGARTQLLTRTESLDESP